MNVFDLDKEEESKSSPNIKNGSIKFNNVNFEYTEGVPVLKNLSFSIAAPVCAYGAQAIKDALQSKNISASVNLILYFHV